MPPIIYHWQHVARKTSQIMSCNWSIASSLFQKINSKQWTANHALQLAYFKTQISNCHALWDKKMCSISTWYGRTFPLMQDIVPTLLAQAHGVNGCLTLFEWFPFCGSSQNCATQYLNKLVRSWYTTLKLKALTPKTKQNQRNEIKNHSETEIDPNIISQHFEK